MCVCVCVKGISVVEQEQLDNVMIEMDGTDNKCKIRVAGLLSADATFVTNGFPVT